MPAYNETKITKIRLKALRGSRIDQYLLDIDV
jgi:hypothetical protein